MVCQYWRVLLHLCVSISHDLHRLWHVCCVPSRQIFGNGVPYRCTCPTAAARWAMPDAMPRTRQVPPSGLWCVGSARLPRNRYCSITDTGHAFRTRLCTGLAANRTQRPTVEHLPPRPPRLLQVGREAERDGQLVQHDGQRHHQRQRGAGGQAGGADSHAVGGWEGRVGGGGVLGCALRAWAA